MAWEIKRWLQDESPPADLYDLLGKPRFDPDREGLQRAIRDAHRNVLPLQNHSNPAMARRAIQLQRELARAVGTLTDAAKLEEHHAEILRVLFAAYAQRPKARAIFSDQEQLRAWLSDEQRIHPSRLETIWWQLQHGNVESCAKAISAGKANAAVASASASDRATPAAPAKPTPSDAGPKQLEATPSNRSTEPLAAAASELPEKPAPSQVVSLAILIGASLATAVISSGMVWLLYPRSQELAVVEVATSPTAGSSSVGDGREVAWDGTLCQVQAIAQPAGLAIPAEVLRANVWLLFRAVGDAGHSWFVAGTQDETFLGEIADFSAECEGAFMFEWTVHGTLAGEVVVELGNPTSIPVLRLTSIEPRGHRHVVDKVAHVGQRRPWESFAMSGAAMLEGDRRQLSELRRSQAEVEIVVPSYAASTASLRSRFAMELKSNQHRVKIDLQLNQTFVDALRTEGDAECKVAAVVLPANFRDYMLAPDQHLGLQLAARSVTRTPRTPSSPSRERAAQPPEDSQAGPWQGELEIVQMGMPPTGPLPGMGFPLIWLRIKVTQRERLIAVTDQIDFLREICDFNASFETGVTGDMVEVKGKTIDASRMGGAPPPGFPAGAGAPPGFPGGGPPPGFPGGPPGAPGFPPGMPPGASPRGNTRAADPPGMPRVVKLESLSRKNGPDSLAVVGARRDARSLARTDKAIELVNQLRQPLSAVTFKALPPVLHNDDTKPLDASVRTIHVPLLNHDLLVKFNEGQRPQLISAANAGQEIEIIAEVTDYRQFPRQQGRAEQPRLTVTASTIRLPPGVDPEPRSTGERRSAPARSSPEPSRPAESPVVTSPEREISLSFQEPIRLATWHVHGNLLAVKVDNKDNEILVLNGTDGSIVKKFRGVNLGEDGELTWGQSLLIASDHGKMAAAIDVESGLNRLKNDNPIGAWSLNESYLLVTLVKRSRPGAAKDTPKSQVSELCFYSDPKLRAPRKRIVSDVNPQTVAVAPNGRLVAWYGSGNSAGSPRSETGVFLIDTDDPSPRPQLIIDGSRVSPERLWFSRSNEVVTILGKEAGASDRTVTRWESVVDKAKRARRASVRLSSATVDGELVAVSHDGEKLALVNSDSLTVFGPEDRESTSEPIAKPTLIELSRYGDKIAVYEPSKQTTSAYRITYDFKLKKLLSAIGPATFIAWGPDSEKLTIGQRGKIQLWNARSD